jgi:hypothetical protein
VKFLLVSGEILMETLGIGVQKIEFGFVKDLARKRKLRWRRKVF